VAAKLSQDAQPVDRRQHEIEHDEVECPLAEPPAGSLAVGRDRDHVPLVRAVPAASAPGARASRL
jgi:hypothetical protein